MTLPAFPALLPTALQNQAETPAAPAATDAGTQAPAPGSPDAPPPPPRAPSAFQSIQPLLLPVAIFAIFYFVMIRPESKKRKHRDAMLKELKKGDRVMTTGGMHATVASIDGDRVTLQIDEGVRARFSRSAIQEVFADESPAPAAKS
jgi:preprotein translocase subunit YajC